MRKVEMIMFTTLDGRAQWVQYDGPPYTDSTDDPMWTAHLETIDTLLLGRNTYTLWAGYWPKQKDEPTATPFQKSYSRFADRVEKVVFSKTLNEARWENSRIARGSLAEEIGSLKSQKGKDIALGGGPRLGQSLLAEDLVDELILLVQPSLAGRGRPLFRTIDEPDVIEDVIPMGAPGRHDFVLEEARGMKDSNVLLRYARGGPSSRRSRRTGKTTRPGARSGRSGRRTG